ncbi:hypothetical protein ACT7C9_15210 [Bacillus cereus]
MKRVETNWKEWKQIRDDLAERLLEAGLIVKPGPSSYHRKWTDIWGIRIINGTPHSISIENLGIGLRYDLEEDKLIVWGNGNRYAGSDFSLDVLREFERVLHEWHDKVCTDQEQE